MDRVTRLILRHPVVFIAVLAAITAGAGWRIGRLQFDISIFSIFDAESDAFKEMIELESHFRLEDQGAFIVAAFEREDLFSTDGLGLIEELTLELEAVGGLGSVMSLTRAPDLGDAAALIGGGRLVEGIPEDAAELARIKKIALSNPVMRGLLVSADGKATAVVAMLPLLDFDSAERIEAQGSMIADLRDRVERLSDRTGAKIYLSGPPVIGDEYARQLKSDMSVFIGLCVILMSIVLFIIFRGLRGVFLPAVTVMGAAAWTVALMAALGQSINMINSALPALVMVIGCADSIHIMGRYSEDLSRGLSREDALAKTFRHIGLAILLTSVTSSIGFLSLSSSSSVQVQRLGQFAAAGILFAYIFSIILIPSVLAIISAGPSTPRPERGPDLFDRILATLLKINLNRPGLVLLSGVVVLGLSIFGITRLRTDSRMLQELTPRSPFVESTRFIEERLGGVMEMIVIVKAPEGKSAAGPDMLKALWELQRFIGRQPGVGASTSLATYVASMNGAFAGKVEIPDSEQRIGQFVFLMEEGEEQFSIGAFVDGDREWLRVMVRMHDLQSRELFALAQSIEDEGARLMPPGSVVKVTGGMLFATKVTGAMVTDLVKSLVLAFAFIFVIVAALFRSLRLAVLSIIPNLLPLLVCMGVMGIFGIRLRMATAIIFAIALGIAVDDTIHFLNRYRRERGAGATAEDAARTTILTTGRAITQTSLLLILGVMALLAGSFKASVHFAILASVIFAAALYAAMLLLPSAIIWVSRRMGW